MGGKRLHLACLLHCPWLAAFSSAVGLSKILLLKRSPLPVDVAVLLLLNALAGFLSSHSCSLPVFSVGFSSCAISTASLPHVFSLAPWSPASRAAPSPGAPSGLRFLCLPSPAFPTCGALGFNLSRAKRVSRCPRVQSLLWVCFLLSHG